MVSTNGNAATCRSNSSLGSRLTRHAFTISALALSFVLARAEAPRTLQIAGIYSDLHFNVEGGDLLGTELLILPSADGINVGWTVFIQIAEGGAPFTATVPLLVTAGKIEFTLPPKGVHRGRKFTGLLRTSEILLAWDNGKVEHLRRGRSHWQ